MKTMRAKLLVISMLISVLTFSQNSENLSYSKLTLQSVNGYEVKDGEKHLLLDDELLLNYKDSSVTNEFLLTSYVEISGKTYVRITFLPKENKRTLDRKPIFIDYEIIAEEIIGNNEIVETICEGHRDNEFVMISDNYNTYETIIEFITIDDEKIIKEKRYLYKFEFLW